MHRIPTIIKLGLLAVVALALMAPVSTDQRSYAAGRFALELDGVFAGWLQSAEGGNAVAEVISEQAGPDDVVRKHVGQPQYEDITIQMSTGMSKALYDWMKDSFDKKYTRKNGAIIAADFNNKETSRREFTDALITEISFPALDAASKDPAYMTIKFAPESTKLKAGGGGTVKGATSTKTQKTWLPSNFRFEIKGLDTTKVNKIEALVIKQKVQVDTVGEQRDYQIEPGKLEFPNLVITFPESTSRSFYDWHEDFVIKGNNGTDKEKTGTLEVLSTNLKDVLFTLTFNNLGIFKVATEKVESGAETIKRVKAEMYVETMVFQYNQSVLQ